MSFEKYGNKLINLLDLIDNKLNPKLSQIGGGDRPELSQQEQDIYVKILSYSINHISILVHLEKDGNVKELENPQISYSLSGSSSQDDNGGGGGGGGDDNINVNEYSIEQQLRLGCDNQGNMYKYSIVLKKINKQHITPTQNINGTVETLTNLAGSLRNLANTVNPPSE